MKLKILITGGSGLLGRACVATFEAAGHFVFSPTHQMYDLAIANNVSKLLKDFEPDVIINCAAQRRPNLCEADTPMVRALNIDLPKQLACAGIPLIHISTDYVFNGTQAPYEVDALRRPLNRYGCQKAEAEAAIEAFDHVAILRLPILYGPTHNLNDSAVTCLAVNLCATKGQPVKIDNLAIRYPTLTTDIARQLLVLIPAVYDGLKGIFHYTGEEPMTKHLMALHMAYLLGVDPKLCLPETIPPSVPRPYDCHLSVKRLQQLNLYVHPTPFAQALPPLLVPLVGR